MRERTAWYEKHGITKARYTELKGIAAQYDQMREDERKLRAGEVDKIESGNKLWHKKDPTGNAAMQLVAKSNMPRIRAIEDAARAADPLLWKYILDCVARGYSWERLNPPCGMRQFYIKRRMFFYELHLRV